MRTQRRSIKSTFIISVIAVNIFVSGLMAYGLLTERERQENEVRSSLENMALLLEQNISNDASKIDIVLKAISSELEAVLQTKGHFDEASVNSILNQRSAWLNEDVEFRVTDESGNLKYGNSIDNKHYQSISDLDYFINAKTNNDKKTFVSNLFFGRVTKSWIIAFGHRYNFPDGRFAGIISARVLVSHFTDQMSGLHLGKNDIALLRDTNKALISRFPPSDIPTQQVGTKTFSKELQAVIESGVREQTFHTPQAGDRIERTQAYRRLTAVPFHLVVGMSSEDYMAGWRSTLVKAVIIALAFLLITTFAAWRMQSFIAKNDELTTQIRRQRDQMLTFLDSMPQHIAVLDQEGRITLVNKAWRDFSIANGGPSNYCIGEIYGSVCCGPDIGLETPSPSAQTIYDIVEGRLFRFSMDYPCDSPSEKRWFRLDIASLAGDEPGAIVSHTNVTQHYEMEEKLRASRDRFAAFAEASSDWFWEMDWNLRFSWFSQRFWHVTGRDPATIIGKRREDLIVEIDPDALERHLADLRAHRAFRDFQYPIDTPAGQKYFRVSGIPFFADDGMFLGYRGTGTEITALKEIEA
ncbi:MAG TPA: PAS domain-containing protein, partial [Rhodospirillaceae bacterium]|nr:PAS domain-containing protein [Rhodospirillaceae bacterium]